MIKPILNQIGIWSAGLYSILENHYPKIYDNKDQHIWENVGFILAYLHYLRVFSDKEVLNNSRLFSTIYASEFESIVIQCYEAITHAAEFYSNCFYEMFTKKTWTLPDKFIYNILRPQTWNNYESDLPIGEVNILEYIMLWTKIQDFMHQNSLKLNN